ncbi:hypothetical protein ABZ545_32575 [Streptomyces abikoensis]
MVEPGPARPASAEAPGRHTRIRLASFAAGLITDLEAVVFGMSTEWSSGPVEGRVNDLKALKRSMFGRAKLPLLRKRLLLTAVSRLPQTVTDPQRS